MEYIRRIVDLELDELLPQLPAIALEGPRAVGKTATASRRARAEHRLDDPAQHQIIAAEPRRVLDGEAPILVDEWQRVPSTWDVVRRAVDADPEPGRFLLTGSAAPVTGPTHSGAGRIVTLRMRPMTLDERGLGTPTVSLAHLLEGGRPEVGGDTGVTLEDYVREIVASGFPGLRGLSRRAVRVQLDSYLHRLAQVDFEQQGRAVRDPGSLRRWMAAFAAATATTASYEKIRDAATGGRGDKPARSTTLPYRETLEQLWVLDQVPAWTPSRNYFSRLGSSPKHHLADPALAARLLGVGEEALLSGDEGRGTWPRDGALLGRLFESLVTLCVRVHAQSAEAAVLHLRLRGGRREVDLILERDDGRILGLEVKLGSALDSSDVEHLRWLAEQMGEDLIDAIVVNTGPGAYRRDDGIAVVPAALLGP